ncbi:MAG TPA: hypothetical protein VNG53_05370, partial [Bacteroidia bacterium]|nr:hypothetical protein [Bacteroidia bacterium]
DSIDTHVDKKKYDLSDSDIVLGAKLKIYDFNKNIYYAEPLYIIKNGYLQVSDDTVQKLGLKFRFVNVNTETGKIDISISEKKSVAKDYIVMTAIIFPFINILWIGCIIMVIGTIIAIRARLKSNKQKK